jgi:small subunit ribosomal protein S3Ae
MSFNQFSNHNRLLIVGCIIQVKVLKKPRFDLSKLLELHGDGGKSAEPTAQTATAEGVPVDRPEGYEPPIQAAV